MFRLNEALRNRCAQAKNTQHLQLVATTVATLSPRSKPGTTGLVAAVAAVAKKQGNGSHISDVIERLHQEGAELFIIDNRLCFRPSDWGQLTLVGHHWRELLAYLRQHEKEIQDGPGRQA
ncbi:hypothetical protein J2W17_003347 [Pseudomonas lini]|uniref:hypothetical protein n=1 Tax=Pseudomonas lini TaxID=163011 RepID=UPI00278B0713|nr:hypothetical protein [Pseudomonas lini]MDQ0124397.1 hypothetical protein [Pseudomonas lini]